MTVGTVRVPGAVLGLHRPGDTQPEPLCLRVTKGKGGRWRWRLYSGRDRRVLLAQCGPAGSGSRDAALRDFGLVVALVRVPRAAVEVREVEVRD